MANPTNVILLRNETDSLLLSARALVEFFEEYESFLNVPRENTAIFELIIFVKNAIVCNGISNTLPLPVTKELLVTLAWYSFALLSINCIFNFAIIWGSFAAVFCFRSRVIRFPAIAHFLILLTTLFVAQIYFRVPCFLECFVDILLIVYVSFYIFKSFLGPVKDIIVHFLVVVTIIMISLAFHLLLLKLRASNL